jgi:hypothetical protein
VTDPRPKETHFDKTNQTKPNPSQVPTNHVRIHAAHDREHGCYNSFTLCRGTFPMSSDFVTRRRLENLHFAKYTLPLVYGEELSTRLFNGFIWLVTYPLRFHRQREHRTHPEVPSCALWVPAIAALPTPSHGSAIAASPNIPTVCYRSFPAQPVGTPRLDSSTYYARPYPYRLMVVLFSWVVAPCTDP